MTHGEHELRDRLKKLSETPTPTQSKASEPAEGEEPRDGLLPCEACNDSRNRHHAYNGVGSSDGTFCHDCRCPRYEPTEHQHERRIATDGTPYDFCKHCWQYLEPSDFGDKPADHPDLELKRLTDAADAFVIAKGNPHVELNGNILRHWMAQFARQAIAADRIKRAENLNPTKSRELESDDLIAKAHEHYKEYWPTVKSAYNEFAFAASFAQMILKRREGKVIDEFVERVANGVDDEAWNDRKESGYSLKELLEWAMRSVAEEMKRK